MAFDMSGIAAKVIPWLWIIARTVAGLVLVGVMGVVAYLIKKNKQYQDTVVIVRRLKSSDRLSDTMSDHDTPFMVDHITQGGMFSSGKLKKKVYMLKGYSVKLDPNNDYFVPKTGRGDLLFLEKTSDKGFVPLKPQLFGNKINVTVTSEDVSWAINDFNANVRMAGKGFWEQWGMLITNAIIFVIVLSVIALLLNKFEVLAEVAQRLENVATTLAQLRSSAVGSAAPV